MASHKEITRRELLKTLAAAGVAARGLSAIAQDGNERRRRNVLFIAVDDISVRLGAYGHPQVKSPNMDRLAAKGVLFEHAYCQYPLCNPCRSSLLTGRRPDTTKVFDNSTRLRDNLPDVVTLPQYFKQHGYETLAVGKIFHGGMPDPPSWDHDCENKELQQEMQKKLGDIPKRRPLRGPDAGPMTNEEEAKRKKGKKVLRNFQWGASGLTDEQEPDGMIAAKAIELLQQKHEKPLFLAVGFHKPHLTFTCPDKYFDMYPPDRIQLPKLVEGDLDDIPKEARYGTHDQDRLTEETWREAVAAYYACTTFVDAQIGKVLEALEKSPMANDTIVIVWGDHGYLLGEHRLWRKGQLLEEDTHAPLILAAPGIAREGAKCSRLVEFVDIYPTLVELCGLPMPEDLEGTSMVPLLRDPQRPWKRAAFTVTSKGQNRSVRTERWRYNEWGSPQAAELYDHEKDPGEFTNLAKDPAHAEQVKELSKLLHDGWKSALPEK